MAPGAFDAIVHAAAAVGGVNSPDALRISAEDNVQAHANLVGAALKAGCRRFLFCSTISVSGGAGAGPQGYQETDARPASVYGWSKLVGEQILGLAAGIDQRFIGVSLRLPASVAVDAQAVRSMRSPCLRGRRRPIALKDPESRFRWLLIDDLLTAVDTLLTAPLPAGHHICNLANADTFTLQELAQRIKEICGSSSPINTEGSAARREVMNIDRAIALWGFAPTRLASFLPGYLRDLAAAA